MQAADALAQIFLLVRLHLVHALQAEDLLDRDDLLVHVLDAAVGAGATAGCAGDAGEAVEVAGGADIFRASLDGKNSAAKRAAAVSEREKNRRRFGKNSKVAVPKSLII